LPADTHALTPSLSREAFGARLASALDGRRATVGTSRDSDMAALTSRDLDRRTLDHVHDELAEGESGLPDAQSGGRLSQNSRLESMSTMSRCQRGRRPGD